jgi:hypothetical protein
MIIIIVGVGVVSLDLALFGTFRPLENFVGPSILTVSVLLGCMFKLSLKFVYLSFVERNASAVIYILKFYY